MKANTYSNGNTPRICIVGAGFGGLTVAIQLKRKLNLSTFTIFEKNSDVGGAWLVNTYPGVQTDIPAFCYSWSFQHNKEWTCTFPSQQEVLEYMRSAAREHGIYAHLKINANVVSCIWNDSQRKWNVTCVDKESDVITEQQFDFVIICVSLLWNPFIPEGFEAFKGPSMHTAQWNNSVDLKNKVVGVIGAGSSGIQLIPNIVNDVKELHSFQRATTWIFPKFMNFKLGKSTRWCQRRFPRIFKLLRRSLQFGLSNFLSGILSDSLVRNFAIKFSKRYMKKESSKKRGLYDLIVPASNTVMICPLPVLNSAYIFSLCASHVAVHREEPVSANNDSLILRNGSTIKLDVLIFATGFKIKQYWGPMKVIVEEGEDILESWMKWCPSTYFGICTKSVKNLFFVYGSHSIVPQSAVAVMECQVKYFIKILRHMMQESFCTVKIKDEMQEKFMRKREKALAKTDWSTEKCLGGRKGTDKFVFPNKGSVYAGALRKFEQQHYHFE